TSHAAGLGDASHMPGETYQRYHVEKARGGLALTMFGGSSYIGGDSLWVSGQLNISTDAIIPHLEEFSSRVHAEGAAIMIQITHLGRRAETNTQNWMPAVAPSAVREIGHRAIPREMDRHDIDKVVQDFGDAAMRARDGGLDGLETMTHGHLIGQFFSPATNHRTDGFGGSLENRCRFGLMVHEEIRRRVGDDFIVGMRMGIDESAGGGSDFEESLAIARLFESEGLIDFVNANYGRIDTEIALATECMPGMSAPNAPWLERAGAFKQEIGLPVFHAAKISDIATARHAIASGLLDMVAMTRAHIADPHIVNKIMRGEEQRIRPCIGASHCMGVNRPTCLHNASTGREERFPHVISSTEGPLRKVVIVGGGPAGLEAARISGERGHSVVLFEAANALGGQLCLASGKGWRSDIRTLIDWRISELEILKVDVRLNVLADIGVVQAEEPDVVIVATGGIPAEGWVLGAEHCTDPWSVLSGAVRPTGRVLIYDGTGRHVAPMVADAIYAGSSSLEYLTIDDLLAKELAYAERIVWRKRFAEIGLGIVTDQSLRSISVSGNALQVTSVNEL
ncbi:MAG: FAD-dependent oxidoreductase, partial [Pseudomonadota bacterium]